MKRITKLIKEKIRDLFCIHNWKKDNFIGTYRTDGYGYKFEVYKCHCTKCGLIKERKYYL